MGVTRTASFVTSSGVGRLVHRRWRLHVIDGIDSGLAVERADGTVLVGTKEGNDLVLRDEGVSRFHLELRLFPEGVEARDLKSKNGSFVGSHPIERTFLPTGGRIRVGRTVIEVLHIDDPLHVEDEEHLGDFVTRAESMKRILGELSMVASSDTTVLLHGETGTGKELLARGIHQSSPRRHAPFVIVDCASLNEQLLASQLFGHTEGAFTGAIANRSGAFLRADGGTVFLDEIGELPLELQPKLLRLLESRSFSPVGSDQERSVDVRFIAATHRSLAKMVKSRTFRADLFYRLAVVVVTVPPLAERREDIGLLATRFAERFSSSPPAIDEKALALLESYDWPGNGRELRNVIERAVAFAKGGVLDPEHLFPGDDRSEIEYTAALLEFERRYATALLARHDGNVSSAAKAAGLSRGGLYKVMRRSGLILR